MPCAKDGHFVCDRCHRLGADDAIQQYCTATSETDPVRIAITLMQNPTVHMHGPEHHFLVPAVLLAAYCNVTGQKEKKAKLIATARERAAIIPGGACWLYGRLRGGGRDRDLYLACHRRNTALPPRMAAGKYGRCPEPHESRGERRAPVLQAQHVSRLSRAL